jgi:hypothetical protein
MEISMGFDPGMTDAKEGKGSKAKFWWIMLRSKPSETYNSRKSVPPDRAN